MDLELSTRSLEGLKDRLHRRRIQRDSRRAHGAWEERLRVRLPEHVEGILASLERGEPQPGTDGGTHRIDQVTRISREQGLLLYHLCRERRPEVTLEIGLAYGFSTIFLLTALRESGQGRHIALDPFQTSDWHGIGALRGAQLGVDERFTFIEERAERALPRLESEGCRVQLAFIDGDHKFEGVLMDFTLVDRLCDVGATLVLDDLWMPAVRSVLRYIEVNRKDWRALPSPVPNAYILEKIGKDERKWDHFVPF